MVGAEMTSAAPDHRDIIWANVSNAWGLGLLRDAVGAALTAVFAVFWPIPVSFCQSLANIENLKCLLAPVGINVDALNRNAFFGAWVKPLLPTLALLGLIQLLPVLFRLLVVHYQRVKNHAAAQEIVLTRFYYFQLINFYVTVMAVRARVEPPPPAAAALDQTASPRETTAPPYALSSPPPLRPAGLHLLQHAGDRACQAPTDADNAPNRGCAAVGSRTG